MKEPKPEQQIKIIVTNPPTQKDAENRIKELAAYLEKIWQNPDSTG